MIHVDRSTIPVPKIYLSERTEQKRAELWEDTRDLLENRGQRSPDLETKLSFGMTSRIKVSGSFIPDYAQLLWGSAKDDLFRLFCGKCAYCETPLGENGGDVNLYRPRSGARNADGSVDPLHYYWLAYEWENTLISCPSCSRAKGPRFPVSGSRVRVDSREFADLQTEHALLLDPCQDTPPNHLTCDITGLLKALDARGQTTIELLNLNRRELVEARQAVWNATAQHVTQAVFEEGRNLGAVLSRIRETLQDRTQPYLLAHASAAWHVLEETGPLPWTLLEEARQILRHTLPANWGPPVPTFGSDSGPASPAPALPHAPAPAPETPLTIQAPGTNEPPVASKADYSIEVDDEQAKAEYFRTAKRIEHFTIRNFKAIEEISLPFPNPEAGRESWLMLLGENGCGKSSILQALALALMGQDHANSLGLDARRFVRRHPDVTEGQVVVNVSGVGEVTLHFSLDSPDFRVTPADPKVLLLGYGATRLLPKAARRQSSEQRAIRILNLFDPTAPLADIETWLLDRSRVSDERLVAIAFDLSRLLMLPADLRVCRDDDQIDLEYDGGRRALRDMSDGFQSIVALVGDIAMGVEGWWSSLREAEGIVLLDEIEVHLHPTWKISIVERLRETCPMLNFIVTTHDPLCLKGLRPEEVVVLRRDQETGVDVVTEIPRIDHLRSDELLSSFLFGLPSTRGQGTSVAIARYAALLGKEARSNAEEQDLVTLRASLSEELSDAVTPMQRVIQERVLASISPETLGNMEPATASPERLEILRQMSNLMGAGSKEPQ